MESLDNLNKIVNDKLGHIVVTNLMKEQIKAKADRLPLDNRKRITIRIISMAAAVMLCCTFLLYNNIAEAFEPLKKYIPGLNEVIVDNKGSETYALIDSSVVLQTNNEEQKIEVLSCFTDGNSVKAVIRSNIPTDWGKNSVLAVDNQGNEGKLKESNFMSDGVKGSSDYQWIGSVSFDFGHVVDRFDLLIDGLTMPIIMSKVEGVEHFEDYGNISYENGVRIAALTQYKDSLLEVKLIGLSDDNMKVSSFANDEIYLMDKLGKKYLPVSSPDKDAPNNTYYFEARLKDDLKVVVPYIILADDENRKVNLKFDVPYQGDSTPVNEPINIGAYPINVVALERINNDDTIVVRSADGSRKTVENPYKAGLRIVVDKKFDKTMATGLFDFSWSCNDQFNSITLQSDGKKVFFNPGYALNDKYSDARYQIITLPNFPNDQNTIELTLENFRYYVKGDWMISLKK